MNELEIYNLEFWSLKNQRAKSQKPHHLTHVFSQHPKIARILGTLFFSFVWFNSAGNSISFRARPKYFLLKNTIGHQEIELCYIQYPPSIEFLWICRDPLMILTKFALF